MSRRRVPGGRTGRDAVLDGAALEGARRVRGVRKASAGHATADGVQRQARAVRIGLRSALTLVLVSAVGVAAFGWPLLAAPDSGLAHAQDAPWLFAALLPLLLAVVVATLSDNGVDSKAIAMIGVLAAAGRRCGRWARGRRASSRCSS
ncbi:hypothetical protein ACFQVA_10255 [Actinomadura keratinilytica]